MDTQRISGGAGPAPATPFSFSDPAFRRDPYPFYARLRDEMPVTRTRLPQRGETHLASRYEDVYRVLREADRFANDARSAGKKIPWLVSRLSMGITESVVMRDGADHRRLRNLVHKAFTTERVSALEARMQDIVDGLLHAAEKQGTADLVAGLALPVPLIVICDMMGVPERDRADFQRWMNGMLDLEGGGGALEVLGAIPKMVQLNRFLRRLIAERRGHKGDDLLSAMISAEEEGDRLTFDELVSSTFIILLAGHETTVNLIGNGLLELLEHPEQLERLRADPSLWDSAVEELLRFTSPVQMNAPRHVLQDTELGGVLLPRGSTVVPLLGAANRDERHFKDPDVLDVGRTPNKHVAFGAGIHFCVGAPLARLEARVALRTLVERYPSMKLGTARESLRYRASNSLRGLMELPIRLVA